MNTPMCLMSVFVFLVLGTLTPTLSMAEKWHSVPITVNGIVTDQEGEPLIGVNIQVKDSSKGTATDFDGKFILEDIDENAVLVVSYVGYQTQEVPVSGSTNLEIILVSDAELLDEVVVVGYGTQRKSDLVGAVANLSEDRLMDRPSFDVGSALIGKVSGMEVIKQGTGRPGEPVQIRIRGINSLNTGVEPLWVVDGITGVSDPLTNLNPNDIESIDVLKDASATAIYGARGANGVILVTTKKGQSGKMQIDFNHTTSYNTMMRHFYPLDADQMMYVYVQAMENGAKFGNIDRSKDFRKGWATGSTFDDLGHLFQEVGPNDYVVDLIGESGKYYAPRWNSTWEEHAYRPSFSNNDQLSIRGGSDKTSFAVSLRRGDEQGLMKNSYVNRYSGKLDLSIRPYDWLNLTTMLLVSKNKRGTQDTDRITRNTAEAWPILPPGRYPDDPEVYGSYAGRWSSNKDFNVGEQWYPPTTLYEFWHGVRDNTQFTGSIGLQAIISDKLTFDSDFAVDMNNPREVFYGTMYFDNRGDANTKNWNSFYWQNENYFNYTDQFSDVHDLNVMVGLSWSERLGEYYYQRNRDFFDDFYKWNNIGVGSSVRPEVESENDRSALNSYFARVSYGFKNKYLLTATGRVDGSSKFGSQNKYGFFPSLGLAWRVTDEPFMQGVNAISNLKLRASAGQTGNQEIGNYVTQQFLGTTGVVLGNSTVTGFYPSTVGNDLLKWETTTQYDIGFELGLLQNKIFVEADYYYKKTTDMLMDVATPQSTTVGTVNQNFGAVENKGVELTIRTFNIDKANFTWGSNIIFNRNKNKILKLGPTGADRYLDTGAGNGTRVFREGEPIGAWFGLIREGTYSTEEATLAAQYGLLPGDLKFQDTNGDGEITLLGDGVILGYAYPDWTMTLNNTFRYKRFDASIDIRFVYGGTKFNINESAEDRQLVSGGKNSILTAWTPYNQDAMVAQIRPGNAGAPYQSFPDSHAIEDASHIRGQSMTIGYTINPAFAQRMKMENARFYLSAENFFLLTHVVGYDPEGSSPDKIGDRKINEDKYQYPRPTVFSLGVNLNF